jgi:hypothetical protein
VTCYVLGEFSAWFSAWFSAVSYFGSIFGAEINKKSIKNKKITTKVPIALRRRLESVLRAILAVQGEKTNRF